MEKNVNFVAMIGCSLFVVVGFSIYIARAIWYWRNLNGPERPDPIWISSKMFRIFGGIAAVFMLIMAAFHFFAVS